MLNSVYPFKNDKIHDMRRIKVTNKNIVSVIDAAVKTLMEGGLIIYPTETAYGVGVDATNGKAVERLLKYKNRPEGKAISVAVADKKMAERYVEISPLAKNIYREFLPGPVTVVSMSKGNVVSSLESEKKTLGIRIPDHKIPIEIIKKLKKPITATSANVSGGKTPYSVEDVLDNIPESKKKLIDLIIDFGQLPKRPPSTVVDTTLMNLNVVRSGEIQFSQKLLEKRIDTLKQLSKTVVQFIDPKLNNLREKSILLLLNGPMGAGKTQLVKLLGKHLRVKANIKSPTYTIISEYEFSKDVINGELYHIDVWRLETTEQLEELELTKLFKPGNIIAIEWANKFDNYLNELVDDNTDVYDITIDLLNETDRNISIFKR